MSSESNDNQNLIAFGQSSKRRVSRLAGRVKSVADFLSEAIDKTKEVDFPEAVKQAAPWAEKLIGATAETAGDVLLPVKFILKLAEKLTEINDPEELGHLACTIAFEQATEQAVEEVGGPAEKKTVMEEAKAQLALLEPCEEVDLGTFSYELGINHPFFQKADLYLQTSLIMVGYSSDQINRITDIVKDRFIPSLRKLLTARETAEKFSPFKEYIELGGARERQIYRALAEHAEYQRWLYEQAPVLGKSPFALKHIYVDIDCGKLTWGEINPPEKQVVARKTAEKASEQKIDPFSEKHGGRHSLLDTVVEMIGDDKLKEPIVIQGIAGSGKSSFTLRLCAELLRRRLRPIRIRLKNLRFDKHVSEALSQAVEMSDEIRSPDGVPTTPEDLFRRGKIFHENGSGRYSHISRYVIVLDGWDEISLSNEGLRRRIERMLEQLRAEYIDNNSQSYLVRVVLTGRPSADVNESGFFRDKTPFLTIRPFSPAQLRKFVERLSETVAQAPLQIEGGDDWPVFNPSNLEPLFTRYEEEFAADANATTDLTKPRPNSVGALGLPLLAHLAARLISVWPGDPASLVSDPTTLYRNLVNLTCAKSGKYESEPGDEVNEQSRIAGADLRRLLWKTATAMTIHGKDLMPYDELSRRMSLDDDQLDDEVAAATSSHMLSSLLISFYFKGGIKHLGCEFAHKSFREYLFAEAIVEALKDYGNQAAASLTPRGDFWKDYSDDDPRHLFSREISLLLASRWLNREVIAHLDGLLKWEIQRANESREFVDAGIVTQPLALERWRRVRSGLADLWEWWGEGVHLRRHPQLGKRRELTYTEPHVSDLLEYSMPFVSPAVGIATPRSTTIDANIGYALFTICVLVHHYLAGLDTDESVQNSEREELKYQSIIGVKQRREVRFRPSGPSNQYFYNYIHRICAAGVRPSGYFPEEADLRGVDLTSAHLPGISFYGAKLDRAILTRAYVSTAIFISAILRETVLNGAYLERADLRHARLYSASLREASLPMSDLSGALIKDVDFTGAHLAGSELYSTMFDGVVFRNARLNWSMVQGCSFKRVDFENAQLSGVIFEDNGFDTVNFEDVDLSRTTFTNNRLKDTKLPLVSDQQSPSNQMPDDNRKS